YGSLQCNRIGHRSLYLSMAVKYEQRNELERPFGQSYYQCEWYIFRCRNRHIIFVANQYRLEWVSLPCSHHNQWFRLYGNIEQCCFADSGHRRRNPSVCSTETLSRSYGYLQCNRIGHRTIYLSVAVEREQRSKLE